MMEIVEAIIKGEQKGYCLGAVTNGYDLDCFTHLLGPTRINNFLQITVKVLREIHDKRRIVRAGAKSNASLRGRPSGSFDAIMHNIDRCAAGAHVDIQLRINVNNANFDEIGPLLRDLRSAVEFSHDRFLAYASIVYEKDEKGHIFSEFSQQSLRAT